MSNAIELRELRRCYGERVALDGVSLTLGEGETLLVRGPNGAGKSTLLRVLATLLRPNGGGASVLGCSLPDEAWRLRGRIGYLGHEPLLYRDLTGRENLRFHARLHDIDPGVAAGRIESLLEKVAMPRRADERVEELSAGMLQRLAVCRALLHEPELLLLDEPYSHLDPAGRELVEPLIGTNGSRTRVLVTHEATAGPGANGSTLVLGAGGVAEPGEVAEPGPLSEPGGGSA